MNGSENDTSARTGFFWDERCLWHGGGHYAFLAPVGGLVQPLVSGGLPEGPEAKRRIMTLMQVSGLWDELARHSAEPVSETDVLRVHPASFLETFRRLSDAGGGDFGFATPFGPQGYEIATLSAGLVKAALYAVLDGACSNAYALSRPPGHHCLPDQPMGFCLLANLAIAVEAALAERKVERVAIIDWDVHHGNGTEAIFYARPEVLTVSIHQERNFPRDTGFFEHRGAGAGEGANLNVPLPPGSGHDAYLYAFDRLIAPAVHAHRPDAILIASGLDASGVDPLSRMMASADTFGELAERVMALADTLCEGRLMMAHEGGYSELHAPFCAHAIVAAMAGSSITAPDPLHDRCAEQQPGPRQQAFVRGLIDEMADSLGV